MLPKLPTLVIRFNASLIGSASYGFECWKVFWEIFQPGMLQSTLLFEGDSEKTLDGLENVFCIAVQSLNQSLLDKVKADLENNPIYQNVKATPAFLEGPLAIREPLAEAGRIDAQGKIAKEGYHLTQALQAVQKKTSLGF